jgi:hypothetical protein
LRNLQQEALMHTKHEDVLTEDVRKMVKRWTIGAAGFYGLVIVAMVALIAAGIHMSGDDRNVASHGDDGLTVATDTARVSAPKLAGTTNGLNIAEISAAAPTVQSIPEVDEMLVDQFNSPTTYSGTTPAQADVATPTDNQLLQTAQTRK